MADGELMDRYWCPRDGALPITEGGYLRDPEVEPDFRLGHTELARLDQLDGYRCVALLGEPGMGKSTVVQAWSESFAEATRPLLVDLREYGGEDRITREVFDSVGTREWRSNDGSRLHLVLDSLDECRTRVPHVGALLAGQLRRMPIERLDLWVVCRTGDWPVSFEAALVNMYGDSFRVYEIAPLRRRDVTRVAASAGVDETGFMAAVDKAGVGPFAAKPLTLQFLLRHFKESAALPTSQVELYARGVRQLCTESSDTRFDTWSTGALLPQERVVIAARLAAIAWMCQKAVVRAHDDGTTLGELKITADDLAVGEEPANGRAVLGGVSAVREVLGTGLFSSRGLARFGWAHESYGEYLAAVFVRRHLTNEQAMGLLTTRVTGSLRVVPQLRELAAWAVSLGPGLEELIEGDPEAIANAGVGIDDENLRGLLVDALIAVASRAGLRREFGVHYRHLHHSGLASQLAPVLSDPGCSEAARELAAEVARDTGAVELLDLLADVALDASAPLRLRLTAAYAVNDIGDEDSKFRLKPLAGGGDDDPDDELKGISLRATWPWAFTDQELLLPLTAPKRPNLIGSYFMFLKYDLPERVGDHLPAVLEMLAGESTNFRLVSDDLMEALAQQAWRRLSHADVRRRLAQIVLDAMRGYREIVQQLIPRRVGDINDDERRLFLLELIGLATSADAISIVFSHPALTSSDDFPYLLERLQEFGDQAPPVLVDVVGTLFSPQRVDHSDLAGDVPTTDRLYQEYLAQWFEPVPLNSPLAHGARRRIDVSDQPEDSPDSVSEEEIRNRVTRALDAYEAGDVDAWWRCCLQLTLAPGDSFYHNIREVEADLTALPGWAAAAPADRARLVQTARSYLERGDPGVDHWWATDSIWRPALAGYKAMLLLRHHKPEDLSSLGQETWARWVAVIYRFPYLHEGIGENEEQRSLLRFAVGNCPGAAADTVRRLVERAKMKQQGLSEKHLIEAGWCDEIASVLSELLERGDLSQAVHRDVLRLLLKHSDERAALVAASELAFDEWNESEVAVDAAFELLVHDPVRWWPNIWNKMSGSVPFGRTLMLAVASSYEVTPVTLALPPNGLADLYLWLALQFPENTDPQFEEAHIVGDREHVARFRDGVLNHLARLGTFEALIAMRRVCAQRSDAPWLRNMLLEAEATVARESWQPLSPVALLALASRPSARVVQSGFDLLKVVLDTLGDLQSRLQGQTPMARFLWDEADRSPKGEDAVSDFVADFLRQRLRESGVVVNREVEVRRVPGAPVGERTDIQVEAAAIQPGGGPIDVATVVLEVKGNWNDELLTGVRAQLWDRYMKDIPTGHGIYVVAWFGLEGWQGKPRVRQRVASLQRADVEGQLGAMATALAAEGADIRIVLLDLSLPQRRT